MSKHTLVIKSGMFNDNKVTIDIVEQHELANALNPLQTQVSQVANSASSTATMLTNAEARIDAAQAQFDAMKDELNQAKEALNELRKSKRIPVWTLALLVANLLTTGGLLVAIYPNK